MTARVVERTYLLLTLLTTLAASFIWGINTLFLLDAGLTNTEAFAANAFFTAGKSCSRCRPASSPTRAAGASPTCSAPSRCSSRRCSIS